MIRTTTLFRCLACSLTAVLLLSVLPARDAAEVQAPDSTTAETVRALESARAQALLSADTTALSQMIADEFVEISRLGQLRTKADNIRDIASGRLKLKSMRYESLTVRVYGSVAVLQGIADNAGQFGGMPFSGKLRYMRVFVRRDGRWQAVAMQHTTMQ